MSITINLLPRKKTIKEQVWKALNVVVALTTVLNISGAAIWFQPPAARAATTSLSTQILSWSTIGLDSNKPVTDGPHSFLIQARVTNTGAAPATAVQATFAFGAGTSYLSLTSAAAFPLNTIAAGSSKDVFYVIKITPPATPNTPSNDAFGKTRPFTITATSPDAANAAAGQTLLIEKLNSQNRNSVASATVSPASPLVGQPFTVTVVTTTTGGGNFDDVSPLMTYNPSLATLDSVTTHYDIPGQDETDIYANLVGGTMTSVFHFRASAAGNQNFFYLIYDKSGGSHHYNADFGGAITVPVQPRQTLTKTVNKTVALPGESLTYTLNYANLGNVDLTNVVITETYSSKFTFSSAVPAPTSGNNIWAIGNLPVGASGSITINGTLTGPFSQGSTNVHNVAVMTSAQTSPVQATADTTVNAVCTLTLVKSVDKTTALPGDTLTYTITYANTGNANCTGGGVRLDDVIPANTSYVMGSNTQTNTQGDPIHFGYAEGGLFGADNPTGYNPATKLLSWDAEAVVPGETGTVTYQVTVNQLPVCTTTNIDNTAKIYADQIPNGVDSNQVRTVVTTPCNGNLTVNKNFDDNGDGQIDRVNPQGWTWDLVNGTQNNVGGATLSLPANNYSVTEDAITGYTSSWTCSNQTSGNGTTIALTLAAEQNLTCTFTNTRDRGTLVVKKNVVNPDGGEVADAHVFNITVSGQSNGTIAEGTDATYTNLPTGTYTVTELPDGSYTFVSYSSDADANAAGAQVVITKGQTTTLTVTNMQKKVEIVVHKNVVAYDGQTDVVDAHSFTASVNGTNGSISESQTFSTFVNPGNVTVGEQADADYVLVGIAPNNFTVNSGDQTVHVTVTNKQKPSSITGMKFNDVNGNGVKDQGDTGLATWTICLGVSSTAPNPTCVQTDGNGNYAFQNLMPGNYQVWEVNQAGWLQTFPANNVHNVTVGVNASITGKDFGNFQLGKISGYKWNDLNGNGAWDQGEPTLSGWTINLTGPMNGSDVTDQNGFYEFTGLTVGQYAVAEVQQNGWIQTSVTPAPINVVSGTNSQNNNFGNFGRGSISGQKFNDLNGNGAWDQDEPTIADWTIYLNDGQNIVSTQTDNNGFYAFSNLGPDDYTVSENLITGWIQTFPPQNGTYLVTMTSGAQITGKDFGNFALGKISGYKWNDLNGNGAWDQGEPTISGWGMTLSNGQQQWNALTDQSGYYEFNSLTAGTYSVTEETRAGWIAKTSSTIGNIAVISGTNSQNHNFGNFALGSVSGHKFNDLNGDRKWDAGEPGLSNWQIVLWGQNGLFMETTDATGAYTFSDVDAGGYVLFEIDQADWMMTTPPQPSVTMTSGLQVTDRDFGNFQLFDITGAKFNDLNGNGVWDQDEPTLAGWTIELDKAPFGSVDTTTVTDGNGAYTFTNLTPGDYRVREVQQNGWIQTTANPSDISAISGQDTSGVNFGNFALGKISGYKWDDLNGNRAWDQGEPTLSGWTINLTGPMNDSDVTDQNGYYEFTGLTVGEYALAETQQAGWVQTSASPAPVNVISGTDSQNNNFGNFKTPKLTVIKHVITDNGGTAVASNFTMNVTGTNVSDDSFPGDEAGTTVTLNAGDYSVDEEVYFGYAKTLGQNCSGSVQSGSDVTCTVTNDDIAPKLTVIKDVITDNGGTAVAGNFTMNVTGTNVSDASFPGDEAGTTVTLDAGQYSVDEDNYFGYAKTLGQNCSGNISIGEEKTCTITNDDIQPLLTVTKRVINDNGGDKQVSDFPLFVDATSVISGAQNGFNADDYLVSETGSVNYTSAITGDCDAQGNVSLAVGEVKACTITNNDIAASISVEKDGPATVQAGQQITYTINWEVIGPGFAKNAMLVDTLPSNVTFDSASDNSVTPTYDSNTGTVTWNLGTLTAPASGSETIKVNTTDPSYNGTLVHNVVDFTTDDDEATDDHDTVIESDFEVTIDKVAPATVESGAQMTYTLNWTVTGNSPIDNLVITDVIPTNTTFVSASNGGTNTNGIVTWNLGAQNPDANGSVTLTVAVANLLLDGTVITNTGEVCAESNPSQREIDLQGIRHCDDDTTTTEVNSDFSVNVVKTDNIDPVLAGGQVTYTLAWATSGNAPISNLVITDPIPAKLTFVSASNGGTLNAGFVTWNLGAKTPGDFGSVSVTMQAASPIANGTVVTNIATVCGTMFTAQEQAVQHCDDDDETTTISSTPSISIVKSNNIVGFANPGKTVTYTVVITNAANATDTANAVIMTDVLPAGFTFADTGLATKSFNLGNITPSASVTTTYVVNISAGQLAGTYTNTASAQGTNTTKVSASSNVEVRLPQILGASTSPELTIVKRAAPAVTNPGKIVDYTVIVKNVGDADAENVIVMDTLPKGFTFVDGGKATKTWKLGTLEVNHERVLNYQVRVGENVKAGKYTNVATVTADGMSEEARATVEVKVPKVLGLATTGASTRDFAFFLFGLTLIAFGGYSAMKQRRHTSTV